MQAYANTFTHTGNTNT